MTRAKDISKILTDADISGNIDVDGVTNLDVVDIDGAVDMASTLQVDGAITSSTGMTITTADNTDQLTLVSTDGDAGEGPNLVFYRNSSSPADGDDLSTIDFIGRNDNSQDVTYGQIKAVLLDASDGTEDARLEFYRMKGGTISPDLQLNSEGVVINEGSGDVDFRVESNSNTHMLFVDAGNNKVGIGTSSPSALLMVEPSARTTNFSASDYTTYADILVKNPTDDSTCATGIAFITDATTYTNGASGIACVSGSGDSESSLAFITRPLNAVAAERMRIDSSGNLLVGKTSSSLATNGSELLSNGTSFFTRSLPSGDGAGVAYFQRNTSNGNILMFYNSSTSNVGSISTDFTTIAITGGGTASHTSGLAFISSTSARRIVPCQSGPTIVDNAIDLGGINQRFDDIHATNGTIQTSDQQEKNTIEDSDLGIDFIKRLTPKSYIFNGKTRTHYGLIAQDVETVLGDISKPTSGFAGFIKDDISEEQDGSEYRYGLRYTEFVAPLIQAVKDQQATIDALTARITALENGE